MAVSKQPLAFTSGLKQIRDTTANGTGENDVNGGAATLYGIRVDNTQNSTPVFLKLYNHASPTIGTTDPDLILKVKNGVTRRVMFPKGLAFATAISMACVTTGGTAGTTNPTNPVEASLLIA